MNIWTELSLKERKMVYNYATEGFINFFNKETMTTLIQKGVVKMNPAMDRLVLFSESFRNFVCVFISEEEIALISFYDPNILNETSAYISGFLGLVGTIYSLLAKGFGKKTTQESE